MPAAFVAQRLRSECQLSDARQLTVTVEARVALSDEPCEGAHEHARKDEPCRRPYGVSTWMWQYSQSALIFDPSFAVCESSWQRKQPVDVIWPRLSA